MSCKISTKKHSFPESQTIDDFGEALNLSRADIEHLRSVFLAVENGDLGMLKSLGIKVSCKRLVNDRFHFVNRILSLETSNSSWRNW